jgi:hypothetical protein
VNKLETGISMFLVKETNSLMMRKFTKQGCHKTESSMKSKLIIILAHSYLFNYTVHLLPKNLLSHLLQRNKNK